jgi:hypothetical protein
LAAAAAIIAASPARAEDAICSGATLPFDWENPDHSENPVLALGHVTSVIHPVKGSESHACPSRAPVCAKPHYLVPGDRVIISARHDAFVCATYINAKGADRSDWLPADAVAEADDKAEPVALADWLGHWRHTICVGTRCARRSTIGPRAQGSPYRTVTEKASMTLRSGPTTRRSGSIRSMPCL